MKHVLRIGVALVLVAIMASAAVAAVEVSLEVESAGGPAVVQEDGTELVGPGAGGPAAAQGGPGTGFGSKPLPLTGGDILSLFAASLAFIAIGSVFRGTAEGRMKGAGHDLD